MIELNEPVSGYVSTDIAHWAADTTLLSITIMCHGKLGRGDHGRTN